MVTESVGIIAGELGNASWGLAHHTLKVIGDLVAPVRAVSRVVITQQVYRPLVHPHLHHRLPDRFDGDRLIPHLLSDGGADRVDGLVHRH